MITVNSLSGGASSSYMAVHYPADYDLFALVCINERKAAPKDRAVVQYVNDKLAPYAWQFGEFIATAEPDGTIEAMMDLEQAIGRSITWVRGQSFDDVIDEGTKTRLPSWARRYCTERMKLLPIFLWWYVNIGKKIKMNIGFRADEYDRMERFFNNSDPTNFSIPTMCNLYGKNRQKHESFNWRYVHLPLIKDQVNKAQVVDYWENTRFGTTDLFEQMFKITFPSVSNCIGCFHKSEETLAAMAMMSPEKFTWFIEQELKGKGTWLDSKVTYQHLLNQAPEIAKEAYIEVKNNIRICDTGGCTD